MKYDVLFIHPCNYKTSQNYLKLPSLELCSISAVLNEAEYSNKLIDLFIDSIENQEVESMLPENNPKMILVYATDYNHINALDIASRLSKKYPSSLIGLLGMVVTFIPEYLLNRYRYLDFILLGNADYTVKEILDKECQLNKCHDISNLAYRVEGKVYNNGMQYDYSLDDLPKSNRGLYDLRKYHLHSPEAIVRSSRGCPSKCDFCNKTVYSPLRLESMEKFFEEIDILLDHGFNQFFFADDTFAFSQKRLNEFCEYYSKNGYSFRWTSNLRLIDITDERIRQMKKHGAYRVFIGIETLNQHSCEIVNKSHNILDTQSKIDILKKYGLEFHASLIVGNPGDTSEDLENTSNFIQKIQPTLATFNKIKVYPGTKLYDNPELYGVIAEDMLWFENPNWVDRPLIYTQTLSPEQISYYSKAMMINLMK